jgi:dolichyl-phosphate beta-glucosyltransferase
VYSIIIPAYNEGARIGSALERVLGHVRQQGWDAEVIVVNDGSQDNTVEVACRYAEQNSVLKILENPGNRGKGYSVRHGMLHASGQVLLFSDADMSSPIEEAAKLFAAISEGADVAIGSRWLRTELQTQRQPWHRQVFGRLFNLVVRVMLGLKYTDTQCGLKAFTRGAARKIFARQKIERWGFDPELLVLAQKFGFRVKEVPVSWAHDARSQMNYFRDGVQMLGEMFKIRWNALSGRYRDSG